MAITDSRLKGGTLTLDSLPFGKQMTSVKLTPDVDEQGEAVETLTGDKVGANEVTTWSLELGAIQDFDDSAGFVEYARANAGDEVSFTWTPNNTDAPSYAGTVKVRAVEIGGEVAARLSSTTTWPIITGPTPTYTP